MLSKMSQVIYSLSFKFNNYVIMVLYWIIALIYFIFMLVYLLYLCKAVCLGKRHISVWTQNLDNCLPAVSSYVSVYKPWQTPIVDVENFKIASYFIWFRKIYKVRLYALNFIWNTNHCNILRNWSTSLCFHIFSKLKYFYVICRKCWTNANTVCRNDIRWSPTQPGVNVVSIFLYI